MTIFVYEHVFHIWHSLRRPSLNATKISKATTAAPEGDVTVCYRLLVWYVVVLLSFLKQNYCYL